MTRKLHYIESYFIRQLEAGTIPDIKDLGGLTSIYQEREEISGSPILDEILKAVIKGTNEADLPEINMVAELFLQAYLLNDDAITIREVTRLLAVNSHNLKSCFSKLLGLAKDNSRSGILRRYYLAGAFEIALHDRAKMHSLTGYLLEVDGSEDPEYLSHLIKIIGLGYTFFNQEDLFIKLENLVGYCDEERFFELGMGCLHKALNAPVRETSVKYFENSLSHFNLALEIGREDARNYTCVLNLLNKFISGDNENEIGSLIENLRFGIKAHGAWDSGDTYLSWTGLRNTELLYWNLLSEKLGELSRNLKELTWFEPRMVIEEYLLKIYSSSRSILNKNPGVGIDQLIQPVIKQRMADSHTQVYLLEQWLVNRKDHELWPIAKQLKAQIDDFKTGLLTGNDPGTTDLLSTVVPAYAGLSGSEKKEYQTFKSAYMGNHLASTSKVVISAFEKLCEQLAAVSCFSDADVKFNFQTILYFSLCFLKLRMDNTRKNHPAMGYLFKGKRMPFENALQNDYYSYMSALPDIGDVQVETMDIASGRADVLFNFLSHRIVTEVKRELIDCSFDNLSHLYMGQLMEYGNTSSKLGIILVLDLTDKKHGIGSFEGNIDVRIASTATDQLKRGVVIIKVPGNRLTPSMVKIR